MPLVRKIAGSLFSVRFFDGVPFEEYLQYGAVGLLQALQRYDPDKGAKFETYAQYRIKGSIMSGLEEATEVNQQVATMRRMARERIASLLLQDDGQARVQTELTPETAFNRLVDVSVGLAVAYMLEDTALFQQGDRTDGFDCTHDLAYKQLQARLIAAQETLTEREQTILRLHYYEHDSFDAICDRLKITKGRVSQLHKSALQKLRQALATHRLDDLIA